MPRSKNENDQSKKVVLSGIQLLLSGITLLTVVMEEQWQTRCLQLY